MSGDGMCVPPSGGVFLSGKMQSFLAALRIPNAWVFTRLAGAPSPAASASLPVSGLIHYLWCEGTHRPRNKHSPHRILALYLQVKKTLDSLTSCQSAWTRRRATADLWPVPSPSTASANTPPLPIAGRQGSWGSQGPRWLCRAAEAGMGNVLDGIIRLRLSDITGHNHHWLRNKYVSC